MFHTNIYEPLHSGSAFFVTVRAGTAYRKIWRLVNNFFGRIIRLTVQKFQLFWVIFCIIIFCIELWHILILWISQNAKWGHAGFYTDRHRMTSLLTCTWLISILWLVLGLQSKITKYAYRKIFFYKKGLIIIISSQFSTNCPHHGRTFDQTRPAGPPVTRPVGIYEGDSSRSFPDNLVH